MQSQNAQLKMRPRNFTHITARMPPPWGIGRWGCRLGGQARKRGGKEGETEKEGGARMRFYLPSSPLSVMQLVKSRDLFLLIPRGFMHFFIRALRRLMSDASHIPADVTDFRISG